MSLDTLLLLMTVIWGTNYCVIKSAFVDFNPQAFNALRLTTASVVMLTTMAAVRIRRAGTASVAAVDDVFHTQARLTRGDWVRLGGLGLVGHAMYQYLFVGGLARTSVANSSLLIAMTPVLIALLTAAGGHHIKRLHWAGTALSLLGIYLVIGRGIRFVGESAHGDLMVAAAVICWAVYTMAARPLMQRHSPFGVTALSMSIGTALYLTVAWPAVARVHWSSVSTHSWMALAYSALFALCIAYTIWYAAVKEIGSARTAVYSNLVPIVAMATAVIWLGEPLTVVKAVGAAAVVLGVALTRL